MVDHDFRKADEIEHVKGIGRRDTVARYGSVVVWYEWAEDPAGFSLPAPVHIDDHGTPASASQALAKLVAGHRKAVQVELSRVRQQGIDDATINRLPSTDGFGFRAKVKT